jgi:hypothetical protein
MFRGQSAWAFSSLFVAAALWPSRSDALTVRTDRPRMFLSNGSGFGTTVAELQQRCADATNYMGCPASLGTSGGGPESYAAAYIIQGDAAQCATAASMLQSGIVLPTGVSPTGGGAHDYTSNNQGQMFSLAVVRDWCDAALSASDASWIESTAATITDWYVSYANAGLDVYHDDMPDVWSAIALAGLFLSGTSQDTKAQGYLSLAEAQWKKVILPAMAYEGDYWHEGMTYVQVSLGLTGWYALGWSTATDENIFDWAKSNANDLFDGYVDFLAYTMRPDYVYAYFGDTSDNKQSIQLFSRYLVDLFTTGTGSTLGQGLSLEIEQNSPAYYDYPGTDRWKLALLFDATKNGSATARSSLPTARWMSQGAQDVVTLRSGWDTDDTFVFMTCGDYFGAHQHLESGSFQIARGGILTGPTGYYDDYATTHWYNYYSQHSVHANTIAVQEPGESFPNEQTDACGNQPEVNEGGQRPVQRDKMCDAFPNPDLQTYLMHKGGPPYMETGDLTAFQSTSCFDYVGCNVTAAYSSPGYLMDGNTAKVNEVSRQLVFLPPEIVVVFDRVDSTNSSNQKRFLLQDSIPGNAPSVSGLSFSYSNAGGGKLFGQTLLPAGATINTITDFTVEGTPYPPTQAGNESGGARLEVVAPTGNARDYFLHVFDATYDGGQAPSASVTQDDAAATVSIDDGERQYVVTFEKNGALGGHVTVTAADGGGSTCDLALGSGTGDGGLDEAREEEPEASASESSEGGTGAADASAALGAAAGSHPGCGCSVPRDEPTRGAVYAIGTTALWTLVARRRRNRSNGICGDYVRVARAPASGARPAASRRSTAARAWSHRGRSRTRQGPPRLPPRCVTRGR